MRFLAPLSLVVALAALLVAVFRPEPAESVPVAAPAARAERSTDPLPTTVVAGDDGSLGALRGIIGSLLARVDGLERALASTSGAQGPIGGGEVGGREAGGELAALRVELDALREEVAAVRTELKQVRRELRITGRDKRMAPGEEGREFAKGALAGERRELAKGVIRREKPKK